MSEMDEMQRQLDDHETRIKSLEDTRADTLNALGALDTKHEQRLREVKQGLEKQIERMERDARERDDANAKRLDRVEEKLDKIADMFAKAIKQTPPWVWPMITVLVAIGGWLIGTKG